MEQGLLLGLVVLAVERLTSDCTSVARGRCTSVPLGEQFTVVLVCFLCPLNQSFQWPTANAKEFERRIVTCDDAVQRAVPVVQDMDKISRFRGRTCLGRYVHLLAVDRPWCVGTFCFVLDSTAVATQL